MNPAAPNRRHLWRAIFALICLGTASASAQSPARINLYRYILDVDVPESAGLIALDATSAHVLRGSAPKPIMATAIHTANGSAGATGGAVDIVPYFLLGGGIRKLDSYRANSVRGRLLRVVTKTSISLAAISDPANSGSLRGGLGLRVTFHDPHDPVLNSRLPESVDSALRAHQIDEADPTIEDVTDRGVELGRVFAAARRAMRARGDIQISAGWGLAGRLASSSLAGDSLKAFRHALWITGQHAFGNRFDVLVTAQWRNAFRSDGAGRFGLGVQRKSHPADFRAELYYDGADQRLHPGVSAEISAGHGLGAAIGLINDAPVSGSHGSDRTRVVFSLRWYTTAEK
jgi:hypothetical protein